MIGNIMEEPLLDLVSSPRQRLFGNDKHDKLPRYCLACEVLFACNGECPKNRFLVTPEDEPGLNYLCAGYKAFFHHVDRPMRVMAELFNAGRSPAEIMDVLSGEEARLKTAFDKAGRNDPCPCGSGKKFKYCHGRS